VIFLSSFAGYILVHETFMVNCGFVNPLSFCNSQIVLMEVNLLIICCSVQETQDPYSSADATPHAPAIRSKRPVSPSTDDDQTVEKRARYE